jgi:hypothetical protein
MSAGKEKYAWFYLLVDKNMRGVSAGKPKNMMWVFSL